MSVFKYFTQESHARAFLKRGSMMLRPLSYYRSIYDEGVRGDGLDGVLRYTPQGGLPVTRSDGTTLTLEGTSFVSSVPSDGMFVWCASRRHSDVLADKFGCAYCVEVYDAGSSGAACTPRPTSRLVSSMRPPSVSR